MEGSTAAGYPLVFVDVTFAGLDFSMWTSDEQALKVFTNASFSSDMKFQLTEKEKEQPLEILGLRVTDKKAELVRGLKIGTSTKSDVLAAYPKGSENIYISGDIDEIFYYYDFLSGENKIDDTSSHGNITFDFDKHGVLSFVMISWRFFDL